jgi:hypothetical protein
MNYKLILNIGLCFIFFIGCRPVEKVGPDICPSDEFKLTLEKLEIDVLSDTVLTLEDAKNKLDLAAAEGINIKSDFGEVVDWKITISNSSQSKFFSGISDKLDIYWYGQPSKFDGEKVNFDPGEVTVELSVLCSESVSKTFEISGKQNFSSLNPKFGVLLRDWDGNGVYPVSGEDYSIDDDGWSGGAGGFKTFAVEYLNEFSAPASNKYAQIYAKFDAVQWYLGAHSIDLLSFQDYLPTENTDSLYLNFFSSSDGGINTGSQVAFKDGDNKSYLGLEQINWTGWKHLSYRFSGLTTNSGDSLKTTDLTAFVLQLGAAPEKSKELMVRYDFILITHGEPLFSE